jgi:excisionase family DNA binding protein
MEKVLLTVEEAAERLSIGRTKVFELVRTGMLESVTIGRCRRIPARALEPFVAKLAQAGEEEHPSGKMKSGWSRTAPADPDAGQA